MNDFQVLIKRLDPELPLPRYSKGGDAGADIVSRIDITLAPGERALVPTGISIALPDGYVALVHPRSGLQSNMESQWSMLPELLMQDSVVNCSAS